MADHSLNELTESYGQLIIRDYAYLHTSDSYSSQEPYATSHDQRGRSLQPFLESRRPSLRPADSLIRSLQAHISGLAYPSTHELPQVPPRGPDGASHDVSVPVWEGLGYEKEHDTITDLLAEGSRGPVGAD